MEIGAVLILNGANLIHFKPIPQRDFPSSASKPYLCGGNYKHNRAEDQANEDDHGVKDRIAAHGIAVSPQRLSPRNFNSFDEPWTHVSGTSHGRYGRRSKKSGQQQCAKRRENDMIFQKKG